MNTQTYEDTIKVLGGDVSVLPDKLKTTYLDAMCKALGIDTSGMTDKLESSYYQLIIDNYTGGSGSTGGGSSSGGGIAYYVEDIVPATDSITTSNNINNCISFAMDVTNPPSAIITYSVFESSQQASTTSGYHALVERFEGVYELGDGRKLPQYSASMWNYNTGSFKHYAPYVATNTIQDGEAIPIGIRGANFTLRAGVTYRALLLWGVEL